MNPSNMLSDPYQAHIDEIISSIKKLTVELSELACVLRVHTLSIEECLPFEDAIFYCTACKSELFNFSHLLSIKCIVSITTKIKYYFEVSDCTKAKVMIHNHRSQSCGEDFYEYAHIICSCKRKIGICVYDSTPAICTINECMLIDAEQVLYDTSTESEHCKPTLKLNSIESNEFLELAETASHVYHLASMYLLPIYKKSVKSAINK